MKRSLSFYLLLCNFFSFLVASEQQRSDTLLVVVLMVKNEEAVVVDTLRPFVQAGVQSYLILDTGSTDNTVGVVKEFFAEHCIEHGYVAEQPFIDFATSRNYAIELAEQTFPYATFMIMPDAEWYMHNVEGLLAFCHDHCSDSEISFLIKLYANNNANVYYQQRLFKAHKGIRFQGVVHETLHRCSSSKVFDSVYFVWSPTQQGVSKSRARWLRDKDVLLNEQQKHPYDPRTLFYLAQTFDCLQDLESAAFWYAQRCAINGWSEENYMAHYRLALVYEQLEQYDQAVLCYIKAFTIRPTRAEPLIKLAWHYWNSHNYEMCYIFSRYAVMMEYPESDILFIEKQMYDFERYDVLGRVAWYVGAYEQGKQAVLQALQMYPNAPYLLQNLHCYNQYC